MRSNRNHLFFVSLATILLASHPSLAAEALGLDEMMVRIVGNIQGPLIDVICGLCYILGIIYTVDGLMKMVKFSDQGSRGQSVSGLTSSFLVGAILLAMPNTLLAVSNSLFNNNGSAQLCSSGSTFSACTGGVLAYADSTGSGIDAAAKQKALNAFNAILVVIQLVGLIGFLKGLTILRAVSNGNTQVSSMAGITHILGGAIAWNIITFISVLGHTLNLPTV